MKNINVVIPCAGAGRRFKEVGYKTPKPLIPVPGTNKTILDHAIESVNIFEGHVTFILIMQKEHCEYKSPSYVDVFQRNLKENQELVQVFTDGLTEGAACTVLEAADFIDNDDPLVIANSDHFINWPGDFSNRELWFRRDGGILLSVLSKEELTNAFSYAYYTSYRPPAGPTITTVAEKEVISNHATVGVYAWTRGADFVKYAKKMIDQDIRTNGEFYICPVYQSAIEDGLMFDPIVQYTTKHKDFWKPIGTPEELEEFSKWVEKNQALKILE